MAEIKQGQFITLSTTETGYDLVGDFDTPVVPVLLTLVSGTMQVANAARDSSPVIDPTYSTYSTAGDKVIISINPIKNQLRGKTASAGVVNVSW